MKKIAVFICLIFLALTAKVAFAQEATPTPTTAPELANPIVEYNNNLSSGEVSLDQLMGGITKEGKRANGIIDSVILKGITLTAGTPDENGNFVGGIIGISTIAMGSLFDNPPASGVTYFADLLHNAGFVKTAYAQGVGFSGLTPILSIWKAIRNFAYLLITVLFVVLGLMIMFRVKLSPQAVVSIQVAIPKIVITLILITFSYAIAGLLIDLSNLILVLVIKVLESNNLLARNDTTSFWLNSGIGRTISQTLNNLISGIWQLMGAQLGMTAAAGATGAGIVGLIVGLAIASPTNLAFIIPAVLALFFGLLAAIIGLLFRIITMLIKAYVSIILGITFGPLQILFDALPGQKTSAFQSWSKNMLANVLVFPTVALLFVIAEMFDHILLHTGLNELWTPPTLSSVGTGINHLVVAVIKLGILMIIPNVDKVIQQALDIKGSLSSAIGKGELLEQPGRGMRTAKHTLGDPSLSPGTATGTGGAISRAIVRLTQGWSKT